MNYKEKLIDIITTPGASENIGNEKLRIVTKVKDAIQWAWDNWDESEIKAYHEGVEKPELPTPAFQREWIDNEDFEADGYDVEGLKEIFN